MKQHNFLGSVQSRNSKQTTDQKNEKQEDNYSIDEMYLSAENNIYSLPRVDKINPNIVTLEDIEALKKGDECPCDCSGECPIL